MKKLVILFLFTTISISIYAQTGCVSGDCKDGYGKYVWTNGDTYQGYWKAGDLQGQGTYVFATGGKYVGEYVNGNREGKGTYTWSSGNVYTGQWQNNQMQGEGTYTNFSTGKTKAGIWKDGKYQGKASEITGCIYGDCENGYGIYVWKNGEKYDGNWKANNRNGQGINYFSSGLRYKGEWKNDVRQGYGTDFYVDGTSKAGMWENDRYVGDSKNDYGCISGNCANGYGIYTWKDSERYEGYWKNNKRNGEGVNVFSTGASYTGSWKDDNKHGYGTYVYKKESSYKSYIGDFIDNKMTGAGTFTYKNGDKYIGELQEGKFEGEGTMYYASGEVKKGKWANDEYLGTTESKKGCVSGVCDTGFGTYIYKSGNKYIGDFVEGIRKGEGMYIFATGDKYMGEFDAGTYNGKGTYNFEDGRKYVGEFANGTYEGVGTLFYTNGTIKAGKWENGKFKGENEAAGPPEVTWLTPEFTSTDAINTSLKIKLCIKSKSELEKVEVFVNNELKANFAVRGFAVVNASCDFTIEREITISEGENKITIKVTNASGSVVSDIRHVTVKNKVEVSDQKRYALIIGNGAYPTAHLKNPPNDAKAIAKEMRDLGFDVMELTDVSKAEMKKKIREFGKKLDDSKGVGLFYYAGHGLQLKGENYLVPVDADIQKEQDIELEAVNLKRVLGEMEYAQNSLNIVILDACRNNPFARSFRSAGGSGLATPTAPSGTFIAYATAPGSVASDGSGNNGLYTQELIKALQKPNVKIEDVFKTVRVNVYTISQKKQLPWENSSIFGDFYFRQ